MGTFVADFETTTDPDNCYVWAYAICEVGNEENTIVGTSIDDFMKWCSTKENHKVYFHNLKFDSSFIMNWLFRQGFKHTMEDEEKDSKTFNTLISDKGLYYQIEVIFYKNGKNINKVTFIDSLKLIPLSVDAIAKSFDMDICKLNIDYHSHNGLPPGTPLTKEEDEYIRHDVRIVARAIEYFHSQGLTKMTIGSCALDEYKKLLKRNTFKKYYPIQGFHEDVKQSYRGGFTYLNPKFESKTIGRGIVLDVNSLYPSTMRFEYLPYSYGLFFEGEYKHDEMYPLYTQMFKCQFKLKPGKIPMIQIKHDGFFKGNEYLTTSGMKEVTLCLNSVDLKLFFEQYDVINYTPINGWKFRATRGLFDNYIDKWSKAKIKAKEEGNHGLYLISKLFLNSLYGKFGSSNKVKSKVPYLGEDGAIHFYDSEEAEKDPVYVAMASFITSYARLKTITAAQQITDRYNQKLSKAEFVYADTDSLHISLNDESEEEFFKNCGLDIDPTKLGAWDHEMTFRRGKYLRQKCYMEEEIISEKKYIKGIENEEEAYLYSKDEDGFYKTKITVAGMPKGCYPYVTFDNFEIGASYKGKKQPKNVKNGVVLLPVEFTIKKC